ARGRLIIGAFAEMYHLRVLADVIMRQPLNELPGPTCCGPPFELPYTLMLPDLPESRWRPHRDVLVSSGKIIALLRDQPYLTEGDLLGTFEVADKRFISYIDEILHSNSLS